MWMTFVFRLIVNTIGLGLAAIIFDNVTVNGPSDLFKASIALTLANIILRPLLTIMALPAIIVTLGVFQIFVNGAIVIMVSWIVDGYNVSGIWAAVGTTIIVGFSNIAIDAFMQKPDLEF